MDNRWANETSGPCYENSGSRRNLSIQFEGLMMRHIEWFRCAECLVCVKARLGERVKFKVPLYIVFHEVSFNPNRWMIGEAIGGQHCNTCPPLETHNRRSRHTKREREWVLALLPPSSRRPIHTRKTLTTAGYRRKKSEIWRESLRGEVSLLIDFNLSLLYLPRGSNELIGKSIDILKKTGIYKPIRPKGKTLRFVYLLELFSIPYSPNVNHSSNP